MTVGPYVFSPTCALEKVGEERYRGKAVEGAVIGTKAAEGATRAPIFLEPLKEGEQTRKRGKGKV